MFIGHNQGVDSMNSIGKVSIACHKKLYGIDVGISRVYGGRPLTFVEIQGDEVEVKVKFLPKKIQKCLEVS